NIFALEDLFNLTIAVEKGFLLQKRLTKEFPQIKQLWVADAAEALRALSENRVDAYIGNLTMAQYNIVHLGLNNLQVAAPADLGYSSMAFAIRDDWPQLGSIIDKGLATIPPEEQSAINRKYFTVEIDYGINLSQVTGWVGAILAAAALMIIFIVVRGNRLLKQEITKRKQKEKQLILNENILNKSLENEQQSKSFYRQLFDHSSSGVAVYEAVDNGKDFIFKDLNTAGEKIDNVSREELLNRKVTEVFPGIKEFGLLNVFRQVWQNGEPTLYPVSCYKEGSIKRWLENRVYKLPTGEIVAVYDDITKQKQLEAENQLTDIRLQQAQKMEAIGTLA
ncbi:MAG: transporter substrate-binding domain-containing protein, partial [Desulfocapsa sp.]|nr:transporter substrate-binding domain-containing protein [Desulfocapsa sp.]